MRFLSSLAILSLTLVTACQSATTVGPQVSAQEVRAEQQIQRQRVNEQDIKPYEEAPAISNAMEAKFKRIASRVGLAGEDLCTDINKKKCVFTFKLEKDKILNAYADGQNIVITSAMAKFAASEEELANVMAHEYAHNVMRHVASTKQNATIGYVLGAAIDYGLGSQGVSTGGAGAQLGVQGAVLRYSVGFEREADYVGLYILKRAGYNPNDALDFWRKMSVANEKAIDTGVTHPTNPERFVAMKKTIDEINYKRQNKLPLTPEFKKE